MLPVEAIDVKFDVEKILASLPPELNGDEFKRHNQLSLSHSLESDSWFDGVGSLYDYAKMEFVHETHEFNVLNKALEGTYLEEVIQAVMKQADVDGVKIGRIRVMQLTEKSCYTLHTDPEEFRYHIPLTTNRKCFFVVGDGMYRMPEVGQLYRFSTNEEHTAVNASRMNRIHIVFDTYVEK